MRSRTVELSETNTRISSESMKHSQWTGCCQKLTLLTERRRGSGRGRSAWTAQNIARPTVADLICSQEEAPHSHKTPREIQRETGISGSSVCRIAKYDLQLRSFKRMSVQKLNDDCRIKRLHIKLLCVGYYCSTFARWRH